MVTKSADWEVLPVVMPVAISTAHSTNGSISFVAASSVRVAEAPPELAAVTVNVVDPHPVILGDASAPNVNEGIVS